VGTLIAHPLRAVAVPPGKRTVRFTFHPLSGALTQLWDKASVRWR